MFGFSSLIPFLKTTGGAFLYSSFCLAFRNGVAAAGGAAAVGYPPRGTKSRRLCGCGRGGEVHRHVADVEARGGGVDHRLRRSWRRADA